MLKLVKIGLLFFGNSQLLIQGFISSATKTLTIVNKCDETVWPGISSNTGVVPVEPTGFALQKGESKAIHTPPSWGGRLWGRTHCSEDSNGNFTCATGDCGSGKMECAGAGATPPATLAKFTIGKDDGMDFFYVSLVGGYNLPMLVSPIGGGSGRNCSSVGCTVDLKVACPSELKVTSSDGEVVACKSSCVAFGRKEDCCRGEYGSRDTCTPSFYSQVFKTACPRASSYTYDDETSTFACNGADYQIIFCPTSTTNKKSKGEQQNPTAPQFNTDMVYEGVDTAGHSSYAPPQPTSIHATISTVAAVIVVIILAVGGYAIRIGNINILNGSCNQH
ncbi:putative Thaumatin family [Helianthus debilis subsp. tardiflorus]